MEYSQYCFVIMPFGVKRVGEPPVEVNFDKIYERIFVSAVQATALPEGGNLIPRRTDQDYFTGSISSEMFQYLEYSRFAIADISGLNPNVFYELGVRHRARQAGTVILRQLKLTALVPFDIKDIKVFPYECDTEQQIADAQKAITQVLSESLKQVRIDSPVRQILVQQQNSTQLMQLLLQEAQDAIHRHDPLTALAKYREYLQTQPDHFLVQLKVGLLLKEKGDWHEALKYFTAAVNYNPSYADAQREKGIAENKLYTASSSLVGSTGEESLLRAIALSPQDYDALASLGGVYKRQQRYQEALVMYHRATEVSKGYSYPLLNEVKLKVRIEGRLDLDNQRKFWLRRTEQILRQQVGNTQVTNAPWSLFDLSEVRLYLGDTIDFLLYLEAGIIQCSASWQPKTHRVSLQLLVDGGLDKDELHKGIAMLAEAEQYLGVGSSDRTNSCTE
jgi:tetratricopeptide (TPR) repeat protein